MAPDAGYSDTPLVRKLGLKPGMRVRLLGAPAGYWNAVGGGPAELGAELLGSGDGGSAGDGPDGPADFTHLFAADPAALHEALGRARAGMTEDGVVWASWPKKASGVPTEVGRSEVMAAGKAHGLVDVKVCAFDETWSALKFVIRLRDRSG